jgi:hypothetical protein
MREGTFYGTDPGLVGSGKIATLYAYWTGLRGSRIAPSRREIDPRAIVPVLPNLFLCDVIATPAGSGLPHWRVHYRLVGTACVRAANFDYTGRYLDEVVFNDGNDRWQALHDLVTTQATPIFGRTTHRRDDGLESPFEFAMMPLSEDGYAVTGHLCIEDYDWTDIVQHDRFGASRLRRGG